MGAPTDPEPNVKYLGVMGVEKVKYTFLETVPHIQ